MCAVLQNRSPTMVARAARSFSDRALGARTTSSGFRSGASVIDTPSACCSRALIPSERTFRFSGAPQASHCIGGAVRTA